MVLERQGASRRHLVGVPLVADVGYHRLAPPATHITVQVEAQVQARPAVAESRVCRKQRPTLAVIVLDVELGGVDAARRVALMRALQAHLKLSKAAAGSLRLLQPSGTGAGPASVSTARESMYVLASGPGNSALPKTGTCQFQWVVGCGAVDKVYIPNPLSASSH